MTTAPICREISMVNLPALSVRILFFSGYPGFVLFPAGESAPGPLGCY